LGSVQPQPLAHQADGTLLLSDIADAIKPDDAHFARTRLLALENTLGGKLLPMDYLRAATDLARSRGLSCHLDGARLFNAAVAQAMQSLESNRPLARVELAQAAMNSGVGASAGTSASPQSVGQAGPGTHAGWQSTDGPLTAHAIHTEARRIAQCFDSVSVCFSKGLGAPVGSALCGSTDFIARAHRIRKMAGGGMRQAGMLAAAASYALDHHVERLAQDHALAQRLAIGLQGIAGLQVEAPQTNIVFVDLVGDARQHSGALMAHLAAQNIRITGLYRLRFVTHMDVDAAAVDRTVAAVRQFFQKALE